MFAFTASQQDQDQLNIENRQARTLFGVVFLFFIGHTLRIILNLEEIFANRESEEYKSRNSNCGVPIPYWAMVNVTFVF